jgi:hypothetical protein
MEMRKTVTFAMRGVTLILLAALPLAGCNKNGDGLDKSQTAMAARMKDIVSRSGGDWQKVSEADRKYLIGLANGDEQAAQMSFRAQTGGLKITRPPSGPPRGPGGPMGGPPRGPMMGGMR